MRTANFKSAAIAALLSMGLLTGCTNGITNQKTSNHMDTLNLTQEWDKKPVMLKPGDIVRCPPGVKHWHGGSAKMSMTHIALSEAGGTVTWLEPVSDEDYPKD